MLELFKSLLHAAKQCIPRGHRNNYVPFWDQECKTLHRSFLQTCFFFTETFWSLFCRDIFVTDISVICLAVVSKLTISVYFQTFWPKWPNFFWSFQRRFGVWPKKHLQSPVLTDFDRASSPYFHGSTRKKRSNGKKLSSPFTFHAPAAKHGAPLTPWLPWICL